LDELANNAWFAGFYWALRAWMDGWMDEMAFLLNDDLFDTSLVLLIKMAMKMNTMVGDGV